MRTTAYAGTECGKGHGAAIAVIAACGILVTAFLFFHPERDARLVLMRHRFVILTVGLLACSFFALHAFYARGRAARSILEFNLKRAAQEWVRTFDAMREGVILVDAEGRVLRCNRAAAALLGKQFGDIVGQACGQVMDGIDRAAAEGAFHRMKHTHEREILVTAFGSRWLEVAAAPFFDVTGDLTGAVMIISDITIRREAESALEDQRRYSESLVQVRTAELEKTNAELQKANRELHLRREEAEAANRAKTEFLSNMSHELRTPLNAIIGFTDILLGEIAGPVSDQQKEYLSDVSTSANRLLTLINGILDLSKAEAGRLNIEAGECRVKDLLDGCLVLFREQALKQDITATVMVAPDVTTLFADEAKIKQVVVNLLSNAFKFTPDHGSIRLTARKVTDTEREQPDPVRRECNCVEIAVSDTGIGIAPEHQKRVFQPFNQIETSLTRKYAGTGLGLSLCRRFVELHGGTIGVESTPGRGSTFSFILPVNAEGADHEGARQTLGSGRR